MKRKLINRNKAKWSEVLKFPPVYRVLILNDRSQCKQYKRTKYKRIDRPDLAYKIGTLGKILVPIRIYSLNKKSRIQGKPDGSVYVGSIEKFNLKYGESKTLDQIPRKRINESDYSG